MNDIYARHIHQDIFSGHNTNTYHKYILPRHSRTIYAQDILFFVRVRGVCVVEIVVEIVVVFVVVGVCGGDNE